MGATEHYCIIFFFSKFSYFVQFTIEPGKFCLPFKMFYIHACQILQKKKQLSCQNRILFWIGTANSNLIRYWRFSIFLKVCQNYTKNLSIPCHFYPPFSCFTSTTVFFTTGQHMVAHKLFKYLLSKRIRDRHYNIVISNGSLCTGIVLGRFRVFLLYVCLMSCC